MIGTLDKKFWEDQKLWYKCIDEKNEGIIVEKGSQVKGLNVLSISNAIFHDKWGDKRKTSQDYVCQENGEFNLPIKDFPKCAPKRKSENYNKQK